MSATLQIVLAIIGSGAFSAIVAAIINAINGKKTRKRGVADAVQLLLYDRINYLCGKFIERGTVSMTEFEALTRMHSVYHNGLDGNGYLDTVMQQVRSLPKTID